MSRTTRSESSNASACPTSSRFSAISPSRFSSLASISVSKLCNLEERRTAIPELLGADQPKRRIDRNPLCVVEVLVARQAAVDRLPQQISERELLVCALPGVAEMLVNQFSETEPFVQFANQNQATVGGDVRSASKSTFNEPLKLTARMAWFVFHPLGVGLHGVLSGL